MSGDCIPGVLTLQHQLHNGVCRKITNRGGVRSPGLGEAPASEEGVMNIIILLRAVRTPKQQDLSHPVEVFPRELSLYPSSLGPDLRTPSTGNQTCRGPTGPKGLSPIVIPEKTPSSVQSTHQSLRQFRDTPRVLRYAPVEKKEDVTPTWGRRKEEVGVICAEKIKDVELGSEREKKGLSSRRTVRRVSQLGSGSPGVASLPEEREGLPCSRKPTTPEEGHKFLSLKQTHILTVIGSLNFPVWKK
ncbi:hypothetical protein J6590_060937 [Homalodisca vitripennis]|nr:hypothetical protein J6590_060937 [Homalodisca vitripennis]